MTNWQQSSKLILVTATQEVAEELSVDHSIAVWHLKQIGKVKKLNKLVLHELTTKKKVVVLKCHFLLFCITTANHFSDCDVQHKVDFIKKKKLAVTSSVGWTEKKLQSTSQSQTCIKKRSWSLFGGLLSVWPLWLSESRRNHYIWEVCSANCKLN